MIEYEICSDYLDRETFEKLRKYSIDHLCSWSYRLNYEEFYEWFTFWTDLDEQEQNDLVSFLNGLGIEYFIFPKQEWVDERVWSYY